MTLRTPRRRISPRAKRRYRVIRDFFRRALGSSSQQDIKINSSIAVNVTDLKHKIVGIEHQLNEVSRHCQDLACIESTIRKGAENLLAPEYNCQNDVECSAQGSTVDIADKESESSATKVFYKPTDTLRRKSDESDYVSNANYHNIEERKHMTLPANMPFKEQRYPQMSKLRQRRGKLDDRLRVGYMDCEQNFEKHRTRSTLETFGAGATSYATTSYHSLAPPPHTECPPPAPRTSRARHNSRGPWLDHKRANHNEHADGFTYDEISRKKHKDHTKRNKSASPHRYHEEKLDRCLEEKVEYIREDKLDKSRKKRERAKLDQDYITEIIQKQYKPTKVFGKKASQISQFSVPVCRDQEYSMHDSILEGADLCSCCYERETCRPAHRSPHCSLQHRHHYHHDCRSMCDTRLYSSKRTRAPHRYRHVDIYNDSTLYDVVPVKEKPSPKSRRKFVEDNIIGYEYYKEVPPSPRTHRPRLNLKAQQHADYEEYVMTKHAHKVCPPERHKRQHEYVGAYLESEEIDSEFVHHKEKPKHVKPIKVQTSLPTTEHDHVTMSNLHGHSFENDQPIASTENTLNKTQDTDASDKTDKALCEIKDILQCFLQEIKKEATPPDNERLNQDTQGTDVAGGKGSGGVAGNAGVTPVMGAPTLPIVPSYTVAQCSIPNTFPPFTNPCCYPMMPMCPMNCMQNGYPARTTSCTCHAYPPNKETMCQECSQKKVTTQETDKNNETEELIKEIYKFVTLNPNSARKKHQDREHRNESSGKKLTSRSVGDSSRVSRHDANVATSAMKCYSKSCEAIGSRMIDTSYTTTQSDTILEKLSLDVSRSDSELTTEVNVRGKHKPTSKLTTVLRSIGLFKKKKTDTESSFEVDVAPREKRPPPFRQEIYDYAMYEQEYFQRPPSPPYAPRYDQYGYVPPPPGCEHRGPYYAPGPSAPPGTYTPHRVHEQTIPEHEPHYHHSRGHPSAPPYHDHYDPHYNPHAAQVPLCLKEIEVKSTGTQSERKMSFLRKLGRKTPPGISVRSEFYPPQPKFTEGTQTAQKSPSEQTRPLFAGWKKFQEKVKSDLNEDPLMYGYKTKQKLMEGDKKMKTAMVKKMFYKRNPFSPNNLIIRTLLGNDPSSFGEPNVTLKPRIFF